MGAYRAARHRGLTIPDDLSIVGFDDQEYIASELDPPLTTVRLPHREMGRLAVQLLLDDEDDSQRAGKEVVKVPCQLVRRDSVAPPRTLEAGQMPRSDSPRLDGSPGASS
jgi:LacI family transcriptional regulator